MQNHGERRWNNQKYKNKMLEKRKKGPIGKKRGKRTNPNKTARIRNKSAKDHIGLWYTPFKGSYSVGGSSKCVISEPIRYIKHRHPKS